MAHYVEQMTQDLVVHGWDLARALGADDRTDPELVSWTLATTEPQAAALRSSGLLGEQVPVADDADRQTRLLALYGRRA